jgi:hypothetical protein
MSILVLHAEVYVAVVHLPILYKTLFVASSLPFLESLECLRV